MWNPTIEVEGVGQVGGPVSHMCKSLLQPHDYIVATIESERFVQTYHEKIFLGLHFKRYGFPSFW